MTQEKTTAAAEEFDDNATLINLMDSRTATYSLLSRLYAKEVDQALLDELHGMRFPSATGDDNCDEGYRLIATYLSNLWAESLSELAIDYVYCFLGHGVDAYSAAFPFESVYTSEKRLMMQDARDEVLAIYRANGKGKDESWKESEDHIAVELEFMALLSSRTSAALASGDDDAAERLLRTQLNFLEDHLCSWAPMMTEDLRKFAKTKLYEGLAYLTDGFLDTDRAFVGDLLSGQEE